jgi:hypothetical protein
VVVTTEFKRLFLRGLKWDAEEQTITLAAALKTAARAQLVQTNQGLSLIATSGNGHSTTFSLPVAGRDASPQDIAGMIEDLLTRYGAAEAALGGTPSDDQIFTEMMALLVPITESYSDFTLLRTGACPA